MESNQTLELLSAMDRLRRAWKNVSPGTSLNKSQFFTLMTLRNKGRQDFFPDCCNPGDSFEPMTLSELSKAMKQTMPAVSQRIRKLEELGYVERTQDQNDRRTIWIRLTQQGYDLLKETCHTMFERLNRVLERVNQNGQNNAQQMIEAFHCLADAVQTEFERDKSE